ncbi:calcineurin-like phosphoesterase family protein [Diaminobutyricimonas aerilata]|uniref:Calcineurin-like phosphoesterase family protein n=1 Tax=Diaminobutyricimonas aerilata TaxID=1162967 RepID=A0A2M9CLA9_9MICO|nr:metallophosphoesterase [Diaminobutyricimonas aerilata]PJJ72680.1 calcineurin-like phosphoesterase family protein [Diaminobutyricimonas aerilata]
MTPDRPRSRRRRLLPAFAATAAVLAPLAAAPLPATAAEDLASRFTLAVLPDTQFYARYSADQFMPRYGNDPFAVQTQWLADHAEELKVPFVAHLGDVVDRVGTTREWEAADRAMQTLDDADVPYSILAGNHDVRNSADDWYDTDYDLANEPFVQWFGAERAAEQSTYGGSDPTGFNQYHVFEAEGQQFLVLALSWRASDATLAWAQEVLDANPTLPVILTTHSLLNIQPDGVSPKEDPYGQRLWEKLIRANDQIFLTFNGHFHGSTQLTKTNDFGHPVTQVLMDYQMAYEGGNGFLGLLEFDLTNNRISVQTASPWVVWKPRESLTSYDQAFLEEPNQQFTIDLDFEERFARFAPDFTAGTPDEPSLTQKARDILLDGFEGPEPIDLQQPGSRDDFVEVEGTLAHWRFGGTGEGVVAEGQTFEDIAGDADLHRVPITASGSDSAQVGDVTVDDDANPFSSDSAAVCFANSDKRTDRFSILATEDTAAVNNAQLENGYTIETFLKIDESWNSDANSWMKAIVRSGNRSQLPGMPWSQWDYTASPVALGLSNLKEFQWTEVPVTTTKGDRTAWSGEIILDRWVHVAMVNDPAKQTTTMYVDGAPVLRNATDTLGHSLNEDMPWVFGADWVDDHATNGWAGCIGETRVIDHPTTPEQWLTARPDLSGFSAELPTGTLPAGTVIDEITGEGTPGATVTLTGDLAGTAVVAEDGSWSIPVGEQVAAGGAAHAGMRSAAVLPRAALAPGEYAVEVRQGFGPRVSDPIGSTFAIAAAPTDPGTGTPGTGTPGSGTPGSGTPRPAGDGLASTGGTVSPIVPIGAGVLLLAGLAGVLIARRRRTGAAQAGTESAE